MRNTMAFIVLAAFVLSTTVSAGSIKQSKSLAGSTKEEPARQFQQDQPMEFSISKSSRTADGYGEFPGELVPSDDHFEDGSYFDQFHYTGAPGERLKITMSSREFDTMLLVFSSDAQELDRNDDGPLGTNSELEFSMPNDGQLIILANGLEEGATGSYVLSVQPVSSGDCESSDGENVMTVGEVASGRLDAGSDVLEEDGTYIERWTISAEAGQSLSITLNSVAFDTFMALFDPSGNFLAQDDDGGEGRNSMLQLTIPRDGNYTIVVNQATRAEGAYELLAQLAAPMVFETTGHPYEKYAFIVGVGDYPGTEHDLLLVAEDVKAVTHMFINELGIKRENVVIVEDSNATRENILNGVTQHLGQAGKDGTAIFYYSGHGTQIDGNVAVRAPLDNESDNMVEALVAYDALIVDDEIAYALNTLAADKVLVLFDSCHSGDATRDDGVNYISKSVEFAQISKDITLPDDFRIAKSADGVFSESIMTGFNATVDSRLYIAASGEDEKSALVPALGMSLFTYFLTETLPSAKNQSFGEYMDELYPLVNQYSEQKFSVSQSTHLESTPASAQLKIGEFFE